MDEPFEQRRFWSVRGSLLDHGAGLGDFPERQFPGAVLDQDRVSADASRAFELEVKKGDPIAAQDAVHLEKGVHLVLNPEECMLAVDDIEAVRGQRPLGGGIKVMDTRRRHVFQFFGGVPAELYRDGLGGCRLAMLG